MWRVADGKFVKTLNTGFVRHVSFSPNGEFMAYGSGDGTISIWTVPDFIRIRVWDAHADAVRSVSFSPDGMLMASGSWDGTVSLWGIT